MRVPFVTLAHDPKVKLTPAQLRARAKRMRAKWDTMTPEMQEWWSGLRADIECGEKVLEAWDATEPLKQLTLEEGRE